jgi:hypothetical protein
LNEKIDGLKERMAESGGHSSGIGQTASMIIAGLAALAASAAVVITLLFGLLRNMPEMTHICCILGEA